jgi:release factor glutamine methyltransferase
MKIKQALVKAQKQFKNEKISSAGLDAEILLLHSINPIKNKSWLCARPEYELNKSRQKKFESFVKRRLKGEPIAYIISRKEFFGLDFYVDKRVMIPRPETEIIVEEIIQDAKQDKHFSNIIDIGTGSGCISIALAKNIKACQDRVLSKFGQDPVLASYISNGVKFYAIDISEKAIKVAKINARKNKVFSRIKFLNVGVQNFARAQDFVPLHFNKNHPTIIVANLPYLKTKDIKKNIGLTYEPISALDGGKDGLKKIKELIIQIKKINFNIFECWIEINPEQTKSLISFIKKELGGVKIKIIKDLSKQNRFLKINKI